MPNVHGHRNGSEETTISILRMIVTNQKTDVARMKDATDITMTNIEQKMNTTAKRMTKTTGTNHDIHGTIDVTLITVRVTGVGNTVPDRRVVRSRHQVDCGGRVWS